MAVVATTQGTTVAKYRPAARSAATNRVRSARLSATNASAVDGAIGMKRDEGWTNGLQAAPQPASTMNPCTATAAAAAPATRRRRGSLEVPVMDAR